MALRFHYPNELEYLPADEPRLEPIAAFARLVSGYLTWCGRANKGADANRQALVWLARLKAGMLKLPQIPWSDMRQLPEPLRSNGDAYLFRRASLGEFDWYYRKVFDPVGGANEAPLLGWVANDLGDISLDLGRGLSLYKKGFPFHACSLWLSHYAHWGLHLTGATLALQDKMFRGEGSEPNPVNSTDHLTSSQNRAFYTFARLASDFCEWCECSRKGRQADRSGLEWLSRLLAAFWGLPVAFGADARSTTHAVNPNDRTLRQRSKPLLQLKSLAVPYCQVADTDRNAKAAPEPGRVRDDLATIHRSLQQGLDLWEGGHKWPACAHWCHSHRTTWGRPLVLSLMALHFRIKDRVLR